MENIKARLWDMRQLDGLRVPRKCEGHSLTKVQRNRLMRIEQEIRRTTPRMFKGRNVCYAELED